MFKMKLQEVCQKRQWALPEYTCRREGPDHDSQFRASVTVNGFSFDAPGISKSAKEAQNKVAQAALEHISVTIPPVPATSPTSRSSSSGKSPDDLVSTQDPPVPPTPPGISKSAKAGQKKAAQAALEHIPVTTPPVPVMPPTARSSSSESQVAYKTQLQILVQRKFKILPAYNCIREGPPHSLRFKATVTVDGQSFESPQFCSTLKEAEHIAAKIALMALPPEENQQDEPVNYKNLLQELLQKEGLELPTYQTVINGTSHAPIFSSTVEIVGETFEGNIARTKKLAEANAAKVAWFQLKECKDHKEGLLAQIADKNDLDTVNTSHSNVQQTDSSGEHDLGKGHTEDFFAGTAEENGFSNVNTSLTDDQQMDSSVESRTDWSAVSLHELASDITVTKEGIMEYTSSVDGGGSSFVASGFDLWVTETHTESSYGSASSLLSNKVLVYPRKPDLVLPKNATLLPCSDDKWVAIQL